ncbi:uncharacterized protein OCT59_023805 [Rhizophagus irregularis]|uniref:uncharacterized protein n=1 Tax=Rhizophagus irregularis TaxID=588596 RepID=UPI000CB466F7|nr:hypothetical protein OCT59_023805 [Rhizophagus irregularis]
MFCSIGPSSSGLIFRFQGSKIPALRHFGSLFYRSNSSFLLGPGSLATSDLVLRQFRRFACLSCKKSRFILCITHCSYTIVNCYLCAEYTFNQPDTTDIHVLQPPTE